MSSSQPNRARILISFACVYFFWGSTFVATRYGVEVLPPFLIASCRFLIAAVIVFGLCLIFRIPARPTKRELGLLALIGILMLSTGTPGIIWSEEYISSGLASLLAASIPLYAALIETVLPNDGVLPPRGWVGIVIGFCGLAFLLWPSLRSSLHGDSRYLIASGAALVGSFSWTCASVISRRVKLRIGGFAAAGWQMLFGGLCNLGIILVIGGYHDAKWGRQAWGALAYLVVFGSLVGFTAYIYLLDNVPVSKVATYAYVNPVVAVALGAWLLHERLALAEYVGMGAIVLAVFLVTGAKLKTATVSVVDEDLAAGGRA